ncbi:MAG: hypothetical protein DRP63_03555 [Planctomycetota bacterium]|nr:MAG: hypothetical protein DRP63_03555 [Planctomycetota bacterium]
MKNIVYRLEVKNFKSLRDVTLDCSRVNVFIGPPGTGKSNILEVIGLLSWLGHGGALASFVRCNELQDLLFLRNMNDKCEMVWRTSEEKPRLVIEGAPDATGIEGTLHLPKLQVCCFSLRHEKFRSATPASQCANRARIFKFYRGICEAFKPDARRFLLPPQGANLASLLYSQREYLRRLSSSFGEGMRLTVEIKKGSEIEVKCILEKEDPPVIVDWSLLSETMRRLAFHLLAIWTNKDSVIAFEEPEAHSFQYYTSVLAEEIASDENNQYFITTHNPYFLIRLLEKTPKEQIGCFVVWMKNYETRVRRLSEEEIEDEVLDAAGDVFLQLEHMIERWQDGG